MFYVGLDLSRKRLDWHAALADGGVVESGAVAPDADGLGRLVDRLGHGDGGVLAVIESMSGARYVHDQLELAGWDVRIADAVRAKGLAPLACKTDKIDAWVLAELGRRDLVPEIWLPDLAVRAERELARYRLHLVKHRTALKNRVHATLIQHGLPCPLTDLFGRGGRELLAKYPIPEPWRSTALASVRLIDLLDADIASLERDLRQLGADHPYIPQLLTCPGVGWVLAFTIASEIGAIERFATPRKLIGYTGLCPRVHQSGERDRRGSLTKHGPRYLRWALIEAAHQAVRSPHYGPVRDRTRARLGAKQGSKIAAITIARQLAEAIWYMLTRDQPFAPKGAPLPLTA
jgi:transposase